MSGHKIAVAGKGGTGKTTLCALVVLELVKRGLTPVLAIDADPDANLGTLLGTEEAHSIGELREETIKKLGDLPPGMTRANYFEAGLHQIISEEKGFDLLTMGRGEGPGCYCYLNSLIKKFSDDLVPSYNWIVMDNEAGLEHISRRTSTAIDTLLIVVNDNPISLQTAATINTITENIKNTVGNKYVITNAVDPVRLPVLKDKIKTLGLSHLADVPADPAINELIFAEKSLRELGSSTVKDKISQILDKIGE